MQKISKSQNSTEFSIDGFPWPNVDICKYDTGIDRLDLTSRW